MAPPTPISSVSCESSPRCAGGQGAALAVQAALAAAGGRGRLRVRRGARRGQGAAGARGRAGRARRGCRRRRGRCRSRSTSAIFGIGGLLMVVGGGRDRRLQLLGGLYLTIASAFVGAVPGQRGGPAGVLVDALATCKPEAFFALGVWLFAWAFPREPMHVRGRRMAGLLIAVALVAATAALRRPTRWASCTPGPSTAPGCTRSSGR